MRKTITLKILAVLGLLILILPCINCSLQEQRIAIVSGHPDWKPIMWRDGNNIAGIGTEVTKMVFRDINVDVDSRYVGSWDVVQGKAKNGEIDAIVALYKTREREEYLYYSISYTVDPIVLFFKSDKGFTYNQKENLIGKKGVATIGDSYGQELDDFIIQANLNMTRVYTPEQAFSLLKEEKVDYFIYSMYAGRKVIAESGLSGFKESAIVSNQLFYIGVSKKSPYGKYIEEINSSLQKLITNNKIPK
jgi:polar amino acid transport system substrate-binding protein